MAEFLLQKLLSMQDADLRKKFLSQLKVVNPKLHVEVVQKLEDLRKLFLAI